MHIFPPQIEIGEEEGFSKEKDIFQLKGFGEGLMALNERVEDSMVMILDGAWGTGKTTFIKMWMGLLRQNGFPVIYFDAFANDYIDDGFTAITGEVISLANKYKVDKNNFKEKAIKTGKVILSAATKIGVKGLTLGALSSEDIQALGSVKNDIAKETSDLIGGFINEHLETRAQKHQVFSDFRKSLGELSKSISKQSNKDHQETNSNKPLIFVIDELDRCKPPFALDLLEKIKHFFSVEGINFVFVTNLEQLKNCVKFSYGSSDEEAYEYLQKFYHLIAHLPEKALNQSREAHIPRFISHLFESFPDDNDGKNYKRQIVEQLSAIAIFKNLTLRNIEKIATYTALILATTNKEDLRIAPIVSCLCALKVVNPSLYSEAKLGNLEIGKILAFFQFSAWKEKTTFDGNWADKVWRGFLQEGIGEEQNHAADFLIRYNLDGKSAIPHICNNIIEGFDFSKC